MKTRIALLSLLTIACLILAVAPAMADTYSNGPYNGTTNAWNISFGYAVSDQYSLPANANITGISFVYWDASSTDLLTTADVSFGTTSFGSDRGAGTVSFTSTFLGTNQFGYNLYQAIGPWNPVIPPPSDCAGPPWCYITLQNGYTPNGDSIYWDENSGPSTAYENTLGSIPSEAFTLTGTIGTTPEPSSIMLFGSGILGLAGVLRRKLTR